jgi:hypothetical protein
VINIGDRAVSDVVDDSIVKKGSFAPVTAFIAVARITESVVYTPVEADFWCPISVVEHVRPVIECPITGRP